MAGETWGHSVTPEYNSIWDKMGKCVFLCVFSWIFNSKIDHSFGNKPYRKYFLKKTFPNHFEQTDTEWKPHRIWLWFLLKYFMKATVNRKIKNVKDNWFEYSKSKNKG